jgi:hypothetical protein
MTFMSEKKYTEIYLPVKKYFDFLIDEYNFQEPFVYQFTREIRIEYIKNNISIDIGFDGGYFCSLVKIDKNYIDTYVSLKTNYNKYYHNLNYSKISIYHISNLDFNKEVLKEIQKLNLPQRDKELLYYSTLIKKNPEILSGNLKKFSIWYKLYIKILRIIKGDYIKDGTKH